MTVKDAVWMFFIQAIHPEDDFIFFLNSYMWKMAYGGSGGWVCAAVFGQSFSLFWLLKCFVKILFLAGDPTHLA